MQHPDFNRQLAVSFNEELRKIAYQDEDREPSVSPGELAAGGLGLAGLVGGGAAYSMYSKKQKALREAAAKATAALEQKAALRAANLGKVKGAIGALGTAALGAFLSPLGKELKQGIGDAGSSAVKRLFGKGDDVARAMPTKDSLQTASQRLQSYVKRFRGDRVVRPELLLEARQRSAGDRVKNFIQNYSKRSKSTVPLENQLADAVFKPKSYNAVDSFQSLPDSAIQRRR